MSPQKLAGRMPEKETSKRPAASPVPGRRAGASRAAEPSRETAAIIGHEPKARAEKAGRVGG